MSITPTYPGIYMQEIPSGGQSITGVATSITAFIGRALRGPVNEPITINSYADFERIFGGLWVNSTLGYAVRDFYQNGGSQAIIVRLYSSNDDNATAGETISGLQFQAASPGSWGNALEVALDDDVLEDGAFNLTVTDTATGTVERFLNLSTAQEATRRVDKVLEDESQLLHADGNSWSGTPPAAATATLSGGSDGNALSATDFTENEAAKTGIYALEKADLFNLLCIPPFAADGDIDTGLMATAATYCEKRRAMLIIDPPVGWTNKDAAKTGISQITTSKNAAIFFPRLCQPNPLQDNQMEEFAPCGAIAGVFARIDAQRGVWKAPAGLDATLNGVPDLSLSLTDAENGELNPLGLNCLRILPAVGRVVWGARTRQGDDRLASEWKYIPVRRLALYIEESLYRGTQWVVFEPNDEPLWAQIRLNVGAFMHNLFRQGAFPGSSPTDAYFVKCDKETTTQNDINLGIVNIVVGFAPLKPAEFVIISLQQMAGQV